MTKRPEDASCFAGPDVGRKQDPDAALDAGQPERPDLNPPPGSAGTGSVDDRLRSAPLSPNELDGTDESQKAADITRAGSKQQA